MTAKQKTKTKTKTETPDPETDPDHARDLFRQMLRIRRFEEKCAELYSAGHIRGFMHLYIGEEAVAVGALQSLEEDDAIVATYREHGHAITRGVPMTTVMAEMYGKQEGCSRGRGGSMHLFDSDTRFYGGYAIVGGGLPIAVGLGLSDRMQQKDRITACFFGEGAAAEGEFHESLNLAELWQLPVLFICENNLYAMGTRLERSEAEPSILRHAESYRIPGESVDGMDVLAVEAAAGRGAAHVHAGKGPYFLECRTYRFRAHSMFDPERYRDKSEVAEWKEKGPIRRFRAALEEKDLLDPGTLEEMEKTIAEEIDEAVRFAENGTWEPVEDLLKDVYTEPTGAA